MSSAFELFMDKGSIMISSTEISNTEISSIEISSTEISNTDGSQWSYLGDSVYMYSIAAALVIDSVGLISNGFVLLILLSYSTMKMRPGALLIIHQTLSDVIASSMILLYYSVLVTQDSQLQGFAGNFMCKFIISECFLWTAFNASSFNLVSITCERYLMVVWPVFHRNYFSKRVVYVLIVCTWLAGGLLNVMMPVISNVENGWCIFATDVADVYIMVLRVFLSTRLDNAL